MPVGSLLAGGTRTHDDDNRPVCLLGRRNVGTATLPVLNRTRGEVKVRN